MRTKGIGMEKYKKIGSITGMVLLDTLCAAIVFYIMYVVFSIPLVWTVIVGILSLAMRSGLWDNYNSRS